MRGFAVDARPLSGGFAASTRVACSAGAMLNRRPVDTARAAAEAHSVGKLLEFVRFNRPFLFGLSEAQVISVFLVAVGAFMLMRREEQPAVAAPLSRLAREKRR